MHGFIVARGTEFSGLVSLESRHGIQAYYFHAYTPAERGSNGTYAIFILKRLALSTLVLQT